MFNPTHSCDVYKQCCVLPSLPTFISPGQPKVSHCWPGKLRRPLCYLWSLMLNWSHPWCLQASWAAVPDCPWCWILTLLTLRYAAAPSHYWPWWTPGPACWCHCWPGILSCCPWLSLVLDFDPTHPLLPQEHDDHLAADHRCASCWKHRVVVQLHPATRCSDVIGQLRYYRHYRFWILVTISACENVTYVRVTTFFTHTFCWPTNNFWP